MRVLRVTLVLTVLLVVMTPARADAWFGLLDRLSGPGPFYGEMFDFRLVCFGRPYTGQELGDRLFDLELASALANPDHPATLEAEKNAWQGLVGAASASTIPRLQLSPRQVPVSTEDVSALHRQAGTSGTQALQNLRAAVLEELRANTAANSVGVLWSLCGNGRTRSVSIDMAADFWVAKGTPQYAEGHSIRLLVLMPSLSWRVVKDPRHDVLDLSAGGGMYSFSSGGFDDFAGVVVQPARVNLHFPSDWTRRKVTSWRGLLSLFNVHYGVYAFPAGFDPNAFNGVGRRRERIPVELVQTVSLFVNWQPRAIRWNLR